MKELFKPPLLNWWLGSAYRHPLLEDICEPFKENLLYSVHTLVSHLPFFYESFPHKSLHLKGIDWRWQWCRKGSGYVLSHAMLVSQRLECSCSGHHKGLQSFVTRINTPFVKMHLWIIPEKNTITGKEIFFPLVLWKLQSFRNTTNKEHQDTEKVRNMTALSTEKPEKTLGEGKKIKLN